MSGNGAQAIRTVRAKGLPRSGLTETLSPGPAGRYVLTAIDKRDLPVDQRATCD